MDEALQVSFTHVSLSWHMTAEGWKFDSPEDIADDIDKLILHQISHIECDCFMFQSHLD